MKKLLVALIFAGASALALADNPQWQLPWFKGIENPTALDSLGNSNGSWEIPGDSAEVKDGALVLDVDTDAEAKFTVGADKGESGTCQRLTVSGVFTPIAPEDLLSGEEMGTSKSAQVGFAVVEEETASLSYYAWVGGTGHASKIGDWVKLEALGSASTEGAELVIELSYWTDTVTATFKVGGKEATVELTDKALEMAAAKTISSMACTGSGTLSAVHGDCQKAVAQVGNKKYATYDEAVVSAPDGVITALQPIDGAVTATPSDTSKEVVTVATQEGGTAVIVQTKTEILNAVKPDGAKSLMHDEPKFRVFLAENCPAYTAAKTSAQDIEAELRASDATSKRPLWQSYALGVKTDAVLTLARADGTSAASEAITLAIPGVSSSGDYTITYKVGNQVSTDPAAIAVPQQTGHYAVKVSFE